MFVYNLYNILGWPIYLTRGIVLCVCRIYLQSTVKPPKTAPLFTANIRYIWYRFPNMFFLRYRLYLYITFNFSVSSVIHFYSALLSEFAFY